MMNFNDWGDKPLDGFYAHIYSNGHTVLNLFDTDEDYVFGMNLLPITAYSCGVTLLMIQLMGTHFHIIANGHPEDCARMLALIGSSLMRRLSKTGRKGFAAKGLDVSIDEIATEGELKNKIIYVYRNSIVAGYPLAPWQYVWGPGDILFVDHKLASEKGQRLGDLTTRKAAELFHTRVKLPPDWRHDGRIILPHSYLDWQYVEDLFGNIRSFLAFLHQKKDLETQIDRESSTSLKKCMSENKLKMEALELCRSMFGRKNISASDMDERLAIAQKLWGDRRTYSITQLSRVTLLDRELLKQIFGHRD